MKNVGVKCTDWNSYLNGYCYGEEQNLMGYFAKKPDDAIRGFYYFKTRDEKPFGLGVEGSYQIENSGTKTETFIFSLISINFWLIY